MIGPSSHQTTKFSTKCTTRLAFWIVQVFLLPEGGSGTLALLGSIRLVDWLRDNCLDPNSKVSLVVDSGTGTTAVGPAMPSFRRVVLSHGLYTQLQFTGPGKGRVSNLVEIA